MTVKMVRQNQKNIKKNKQEIREDEGALFTKPE
jgi:hypothetical protein